MFLVSVQQQQQQCSSGPSKTNAGMCPANPPPLFKVQNDVIQSVPSSNFMGDLHGHRRYSSRRCLSPLLFLTNVVFRAKSLPVVYTVGTKKTRHAHTAVHTSERQVDKIRGGK